MKILLAIDGSECSQSAVESVARRPWPADSEIKVVSAIEFPFVPAPEAWTIPHTYYAQVADSAGEQAQQIVDKAVARLDRNQVAVTAEVLRGRARDVILEAAEKWPADLIVVGSHGYNGWQRFWLGSVSQAIANHAHCSVEIVRQPQ